MVKKKITAAIGVALLVSAVPGMVFANEDEGNVDSVVTGNDIGDQNQPVPTLYADGETPDDNDSVKLREQERKELREGDEKFKKQLRDGERNLNNQNSKSNKFDSEIRTQYMFTSLVNRIDLQVESAIVISNKAEELEKDVDFSEIIKAMEQLVSDINSYVFDEDIDPETIKLEFDTYRDEAKVLTKQFKDLTKDLFTEEEKASIREELKEVKKVNQEKHRENVQTMRMNIQMNSAKKFLDRMGVDSSAVLEKIESGEIPEDQVKDALKELYNSLKVNKKNELIQKYKEEKVKKDIALKEKKEKNREKYEAKKNELNEKKIKFNERKIKFDEKRNELNEKRELNKKKVNEENKNDSSKGGNK